MIRSIFFSLLIICSATIAAIPDLSFTQEYHIPYAIGELPEANDVREVLVDDDQNIWAATKAGLFKLKRGESDWQKVYPASQNHSFYSLTKDENGNVLAGGWNGVFICKNNSVEKIDGINEPISAMACNGNKVLALGPKGQWYIKNGQAEKTKFYCSANVQNITPSDMGGFWISTSVGLFHHGGGKELFYQNAADLLSAYIVDAAYTKCGQLWIGSLGGITVYEDGFRTKTYHPKDGIPSAEVTCVASSPNGVMWVGTTKGATRFNGESWSVRHSRRWLLSDDVRDIKFDKEGTAWIATANGISAIKKRKMTLDSKSNYFQRILEARHTREPGLTEKCLFTIPGDTTTWGPRDDDNDGEYTGMYLAMESYRYAVTKSPKALTNAKKAFRGLRFLQEITETDGFFARTVIPSTWTRMFDPNKEYTEEQWADRLVHNARDKYVPELWRPSSDGKWLWKGDTSSDEMTGHMYGYLHYFDFAADENEKKEIAKHVCKIVDYLIKHNYNFVDIDGRHTKWGVWSPDQLMGDPDWSPERYINSVEILSYLKLAYHVSGKKKYQQEYEKLLYEHNYVENITKAKHYNPAFRTHIDDELLAITYPCLLHHENDPELKALYRESVENWYRGLRQDQNAYFNFLYSAMLGKKMDLMVSVESLKDASIDLVQWRIDNTQREDLDLVRFPELEAWQTSRLVPPSERCMMRLDKNPWLAVQGDGGYSESDGVWYLLPYWMGRYYGYIESPGD
jgi:hypothetical protein